MYRAFGLRRAFGGLCFLSLFSVFAAGCGKTSDRDAGTVRVTGKATYNGQPLSNATITFNSDETNPPGAAMTGAEGNYQLRVKPGHYTATVSKLNIAADDRQVSMEEAMANAQKPKEDPKETLPPKYQNVAESPFKFEVKASGENKCDLSLSD